ncbi:MAG: fibronectin type III domain-containing protein, partial [Terriglobia bacterium]
QLRWTAPERSVSGIALPELRGYKVYRGSAAEPELFSVIGQTRSPAYRDTHFRFGATYIYRVRAVFTQDGYTAETADSSPVEITPAPIFPPLAPQGLTAVFTGETVDLIWRPSAGPGVAGYNVYRREPGQSGRRINQQLLRTPVFTDKAVAPDTRYSYWVTAVGANRRESKPSSEVSVEAR